MLFVVRSLDMEDSPVACETLGDQQILGESLGALEASVDPSIEATPRA